MMLPILISVSLAPGSYFFCAAAAVAVSANATNAVKATSFFGATDIVSLPVDVLFCAKCRKSGRSMQASACCAPGKQTSLRHAIAQRERLSGTYTLGCGLHGDNDARRSARRHSALGRLSDQ